MWTVHRSRTILINFTCPRGTYISCTSYEVGKTNSLVLSKCTAYCFANQTRLSAVVPGPERAKPWWILCNIRLRQRLTADRSETLEWKTRPRSNISNVLFVILYIIYYLSHVLFNKHLTTNGICRFCFTRNIRPRPNKQRLLKINLNTFGPYTCADTHTVDRTVIIFRRPL